MQLNEVVSSNIKAVGLTDKGLIVQFQSGVKYLYEGVTKKVYDQLMEAESKGKFINTNIKGNYNFTKVVD